MSPGSKADIGTTRSINEQYQSIFINEIFECRQRTLVHGGADRNRYTIHCDGHGVAVRIIVETSKSKPDDYRRAKLLSDHALSLELRSMIIDFIQLKVKRLKFHENRETLV